MARIRPVGEPVNDAERMVIAHLRDHAPDNWIVLHNLEIRDRGELFELDLLVLTPHAVYLSDVKGTHGRIEVRGGRWHQQNGGSFLSPAAKLRSHARVVKGLLTKADTRLNAVYVGAIVVLPALDAVLVDPTEKDAGDVVRLEGLVGALADSTRVNAARFSRDITQWDDQILTAIGDTARKPTRPRRFGSWEVVEALGGDDEVTEYRARNAAAAGTATVRLQVHRADPYLPEAERRRQQFKIGNAYEALGRVPPHRNLVTVRDYFPDGDETLFILVLDDVPGDSLRAVLAQPTGALSADAKLRIVRGMIEGLNHAHAHGVAHRALSPDSVLVAAADGRALLTGFDYARPEKRTESPTVQPDIPRVIDPRYVAPEAQQHPERLGRATDLYALGALAYEVFTGAPPFSSATEQHQRSGEVDAGELRGAGVPDRVVEWVGKLCSPDPAHRPTASVALRELEDLLRDRSGGVGGGPPVGRSPGGPGDRDGSFDPAFYKNLPANYQLTDKYTIRKRLGKPSSFGTVYHVHDVFARTDKVLKLIISDNTSLLDRLLREYHLLQDLPDHPYVVRAVDADILPGSKIPFLVFEYLEGLDVAELAKDGLLSPADVLTLGTEAAEGLAHVHRNGVYHCDIKPANLLRTVNGCKIIDFNVSIKADSSLCSAGGSARYLPPDLLNDGDPSAPDFVDRDVYALGITLYEAISGAYPWPEHSRPPVGQPPRPLTEYIHLHDLSPAYASAITAAISPTRADRYSNAPALLDALKAVGEPMLPQGRDPAATVEWTPPSSDAQGDNPFLVHLQTLYSQSRRSNRGTRGLDPATSRIYVTTRLDHALIPDVLNGVHSLVVITGNAGDGKTAFLENLVADAKDRGASVASSRANGAEFTLGGRSFLLNHDGSQDEGDRSNDDVLAEFFGPFAGDAHDGWPDTETRLIAINEGRLVDFLGAHEAGFAALREIVADGLAGKPTSARVAVVNLNNRSVVAAPGDDDPDTLDGPIFDRMVKRMVEPQFWDACGSCELANRCYALHNARTFTHPTVGRHVTERLRTLYTLTHLRGKLHITLRDLRSALAYTLASGRDCGEIRELYARGDPTEISEGFYFNSWAGTPGTKDRLLSLLREVDIASVAQPRLDRRLDYLGPAGAGALMSVDQRGSYDTELLEALHQRLDRAPDLGEAQVRAHRDYLAAARRRHYFESADAGGWRGLLPYRSAERFLELIGHPKAVAGALSEVLTAINRDEGLSDPERLGPVLALQVREVPGGTIRSYRTFAEESFALRVREAAHSAYIESAPESLVLTDADGSERNNLVIQLDLFEMLHRLRSGGLPTRSELQGRHLSLTVFKNVLAAAPYQEILLTRTGTDQRTIRRESGGRLVMTAGNGAMDGEAPHGTA